MAIVQHQKNFATLAAGAHSITCAFSPSVTAGNTLVVIFAADPGNTAGNSVTSPAISDTLLNGYTSIDFGYGHYPGTGVGLGAFYFPNTGTGANTVTLNLTSTYGCTVSIEIFEVSGLGASPTLQSHEIVWNNGSATKSTTWTDSIGNSVEIDWNFGSSGYLSTVLSFDLHGASGDFIVAATAANPSSTNPANVPTFSPSTYGTLSLLDFETSTGTSGSGSAQLYVFTYSRSVPVYAPTPPTNTPPAYLEGFDRDIISFDQIRSADRQGTGRKFAMWVDTATGDLVAIAADGSIGDSGLPISLVASVVNGQFLFDDAGNIIIDDRADVIRA